ncbi:MAG: amidohydrolase family protein, partial [Oscillospiraceae bacterium]|nr:amidohydrolase family protein [Oscillospiraceae bacterium]
MIIDFHTHIFPEKIADRAIAVLEEQIARVSADESYRTVSDARRDTLIESMDANGIDISVVLPVATKLSQVRSINDFALKINSDEKINSRLISFGSVHPGMSERDIDFELERIAQNGIKGIKMHPESQEMYINSKEAIHIINKAYELGLTVVLHTGRDLGFPPPVHCSPERLRCALDYFDGSNVVAAHFGGFRMWDDVLRYLSGTNIYIDTALTVREIDGGLFEEIIKRHTPDKVLYGSDSPWEKQNTAYEYMTKTNIEG